MKEMKNNRIIELQLGCCLTAPTKRMIADLEEVALECNVVRNGIVRVWERWREDHPEWQPNQVTSHDGTPAFYRDGRPVLQNMPLPAEITDGQCTELTRPRKKRGKDEIAESKRPSAAGWLARIGCEIAPTLDANIVSALRDQVYKSLRGNVPYNHTGKASYKHEAILLHEASRDCFRKASIPAHNKSTALAYNGHVSTKINKKLLAEMAKDTAVVRFALFSKKSGRKTTYHICRVEVGRKSQGDRRLLAKIADGSISLGCSRILRKDDGKWYIQLVYDSPIQQMRVDPDKIATLAPLGKDDTHPLAISDGIGKWKLGHVNMLMAQYKRLNDRQFALRHDYRTSGSGAKGHGKSRFFRDIKPLSRQTRNLMEAFSKKLCSQVVEYCERFSCGKVIYREPRLGLRQHDWFANRDIDFHWTGLLARLTQLLKHNGIELEVERIGMKELNDVVKNQKGASK